jgi:hypothetical protein
MWRGGVSWAWVTVDAWPQWCCQTRNSSGMYLSTGPWKRQPQYQWCMERWVIMDLAVYILRTKCWMSWHVFNVFRHNQNAMCYMKFVAHMINRLLIVGHVSLTLPGWIYFCFCFILFWIYFSCFFNSFCIFFIIFF